MVLSPYATSRKHAAEIGERVGIGASVAGCGVGSLVSVVVTDGVLSFGSMQTGFQRRPASG